MPACRMLLLSISAFFGQRGAGNYSTYSQAAELLHGRSDYHPTETREQLCRPAHIRCTGAYQTVGKSSVAHWHQLVTPVEQRAVPRKTEEPTILRSRPGASNQRHEDVDRSDGAILEPAASASAAIAAATAERSSATAFGTRARLANAERSLLH